MGADGPGLYSDDFAADLRATVGSVCRLPLSPAEILATLIELEPSATMPDDEEYSTFWLVVADQLHRRGIQSAATDRAIEVIDDGTNLAVLESLEMSEADLRKRAKILQNLRLRLVKPPPAKRRTVLTAPQPLLLNVGEVYAFPADRQGNCRNPYFPDDSGFVTEGWGSFVVVASGHALGYLAWYAIAVGPGRLRRRPDLDEAVAELEGAPYGLGTLTRQHMRRMQLEKLGVVVPPAMFEPAQEDVMETVGADISLSNALSLWLQPATSGSELDEALTALAWQHDPLGLDEWRSELGDEYAAWVRTVRDTTAEGGSEQDVAARLDVQFGGDHVDRTALKNFAHAAWLTIVISAKT
ncbi:hypothetical protein [Cellulomonas sp. ATA003]|uniref:hypothetical protein n=1 Tax=Cellulomonas sp. ATA003 TaxID=3073064 RepID=UPI002873D16A|nr:hypothetical protein [Cellulomonas sp. ATA003]WNB84344.1 hypothetical protein REH70_10660 [Cellulomonas sp. ATA003]